MFNFIKKLKNKKNAQANIKTSIICPKCRGNIFEKDDCWICENTLIDKCNINISNIYKGQKLDFKYLIAFEKSVQYRCCFVPARISNYEKEWRIKAGLINPTHLSDTHCGICRSNLYRDRDKVVCTQCDFKISTIYKEVNFSNQEITDLLNYRVSEEFTFYHKNGEPFKGRVLLNKEKKPAKYIFVEDIYNLDKEYKEKHTLPRSLENKYDTLYFDKMEEKISNTNKCI